jgi:hypothetical protein
VARAQMQRALGALHEEFQLSVEVASQRETEG